MSFRDWLASKLATDSFFVTPHGAGSTFDRSTGGKYQETCLDRQELRRLYESNGLVKAVVGRLYEDGIRNGYGLSAPGQDPEKLSEIRMALRKWDEDNKLLPTILTHLVQKALFGGAALLHVDAKANQEMPYRANRKGDPRFLAFAPHELIGHDIDRDPASPTYRYPTRWQIDGDLTSLHIDSSWVKPAAVEKVYSHNNRESWEGTPVLESFYQQLRAWDISMQAATSALQEISRTIYKLKGAAMVAGSSAEAQARLRQRIRQIEEAASMFTPAILDESETMERSPISVGGIGEVLDRIIVSLCGHARMPVTVLFGTSPGGFGTGESELRIWQDRVRYAQRTEILPTLRWCVERLFSSGVVEAPSVDWNLTFPPLLSPSEEEDSRLRNLQAQTDSIYVAAGVLSPEEVAEARFGGDWTMETELDRETRDRDALDPNGELSPEDEEEARLFNMRLGRGQPDQSNALLRGKAGAAQRPNLQSQEQKNAAFTGDSEDE